MTFNPAPTYGDEIRTIPRMMQALLDDIVAAYSHPEVAAVIKLPSRRYWTLQLPAADCEQLVVSFNQAYVGMPGDEAATPQPCDGPRSVSVNVQVIRCIPTMSPKGRAPTPEQIEAASEQLAIDAYLLLDVSKGLDQWDPLGAGMGVIATVNADDPQGGFQGVTMTLAMAMP